MSFNPFEEADPWEVSTDTLLGLGNHLVRIVEAEDGTTSNHNPQVTLKFENDSGSIRAWEAYHSDFLRKLVSLYQAAGVQLPQPGEFDPGDNCRLSQPCIDRLLGQWVGIVVREEDDIKNPGQKRPRVQGYVTPDKVGGQRKAPATVGAGAVASTPSFSQPNIADDQDIPF